MSTPPDQVIDPNLLQQFAGQQDTLATDTQDYGDLSKQASDSAKERFSQDAPERNTGIMSVAPYLIGLAALGGKSMGIHPISMLSATNGMVQGMLKGSEQRYQDEKKKYDDAYQKWLDKWTQQQRIFNEMRQVYKGRIDADIKAMEATFKMMGINEKSSMDTFKKFMQSQQYGEKLREFNESEERKRGHDQIMADMANRRGGGSASDRAKQLDSALSIVGTNITGARSGAVYWQRLEDMVTQNPDKSPQEIAQMVKSGQVDMKIAQTEAGVLGRKEAGVSGALTSLTQKGGFFDQVDEAAKKVNFGDAKTMNQIRLAAQGKTVANPDIMTYRNKIEDLRAEYTQVLSRSGVPTESVRRQSEEMFPLDMSYEEYKAAKKASIEIAQAVLSGNEKVIEAVKTGKPLSEILNLSQQSSGGPKDGDTGTSKSGKPIVFRNGQWEYQ